MNQPPPPPRQGPSSPLGVASFVLGLVGFLIGLLPCAGFLGTVGLVLGIVDLKQARTQTPRPTSWAIGGIVFGGLATAGALAWVVALVAFEQAAAKGSCPHLYAYDGADYRLDADLASGALYRAAEKDDIDRLESLRPVAGEYRVRLQNDLEEIDNVDALSLLVVDADPGVEILPTQANTVVAVRDAAAPLRSSRDTARAGAEPRERWTFEFARPRGDRALLVIRGRTTPFAEQAFVHYMAEMGQGVRPLLEYRADTGGDCACFHAYMDAEVERLGLPLWVSVGDGTHTSLQPVGPAITRSQALSIDLPPITEGDRVTIRLEGTPRFWEIGEVSLAPESTDGLHVETLAPRSALTGAGADVLGLLADTDARRVVMKPGEHVDVRFQAPAIATGKTRTVLARLRGYYDLDIGGTAGVDVARMIAHRLGWVSLPRYAEKL